MFKEAFSIYLSFVVFEFFEKCALVSFVIVSGAVVVGIGEGQPGFVLLLLLGMADQD